MALGFLAGVTYSWSNGREAGYRMDLLNLQHGCEEAVAQVTQVLSSVGLRTVRSFDVDSACAPRPNTPCPHDGSMPCACQLIVLIVHGLGLAPIALVAHGHGGQTAFALVDAPEHPAEPKLTAMVEWALTPENFAFLNHGLFTNATFHQQEAIALHSP